MSGCEKFLKDQSGATSIEYSLIAAFIAMAIITAVTLVGVEVKSTFEAAQQGLEKRPPV